MTIIITDKRKDIYLTAEEHVKWIIRYQAAMSGYAVRPISLEEYIRRNKRSLKERIK
jgi:hypothetical protein